MKKRLRLVILVLIVALIVLLRLSPLGEELQVERLAARRDALLDLVHHHAIVSAASFVLIYIAVTALSIPGATILSLLGGFLFGPVFGVLLINMGASSGALLVFLAARFLFGESVQKRYGERLARFNEEIRKNGSNYLLTLRLIPLFPFFLINLFAGFTRIPVLTFLWTTVVGIIPGSFVYAYLGYTGATLEPNEGLLSPQIIIALVLLGLLSILPVIVRKLRHV
jgi:uncharacterized membrane protein YdjX (TVP38/TMEM64 family)